METFKKISKAIFSIFISLYNFLARWCKAKSKEYPYFTKSLILHFAVIIFVSGAIPSCAPDVERPKVITVDIIPMQMESKKVVKQLPKPRAVSKKQIKKAEKPKPKEKRKPKPLKKTKSKPVKKEKKEEVKKEEPKIKKESPLPNIKKPEKKKEDKKKKAEEKKEEVKKEEDQEGKKSLLKDLEKKEESLDELIDEIDKDDKKEEKKEKPQPKPKKEAPKVEEFVPDAAFIREIDNLIKGQISGCWSIPIGTKNVDNMQVVLHISLDKKGNATAVKIVDRKRYASDNNYRVLTDSAVWAVKECSPLRGLDEDKHKFWKEIEFTFDPSMVL